MQKNALIVLIICLISFYSEGQETGLASFYNDFFAGKTTASGERYDPNKLTAAHKSLPIGTLLKVTNLDNAKSVIVRVNDRGPYVRGRILDLSRSAAAQLGILLTGFAKVSYEVIENKIVTVQDTFAEQAPEGKFYVVSTMDTCSNLGYGVKLGSFDDPKLAFTVSKDLKTKYNATAYIQTVKMLKGSLYRIFVGNFASEADAEALQETLKKYSPDCVVVSYDCFK